MLKCNECGAEYVEGALYCVECGVFLMAESEAEDFESTVQIPAAPSNGTERTVPFERRPGFGSRPEQVLFMISNSGRRVAFELNEKIQIGREDPGKEIWPELDLTPDKGLECGVSRRHALLKASEEGAVLVDLGSTNGTQVNNEHLSPEKPHPLKNGDHIRLGGLLIQIFFES